MNLTIELPELEVQTLAEKARSQGMSSEGYARMLIEQDLRLVSAPPRVKPKRRISEEIREVWADLPAEVQAKIPVDGSTQVDHYVYGLPKR
jgi:hypothetical protein